MAFASGQTGTKSHSVAHSDKTFRLHTCCKMLSNSCHADGCHYGNDLVSPNLTNDIWKSLYFLYLCKKFKAHWFKLSESPWCCCSSIMEFQKTLMILSYFFLYLYLSFSLFAYFLSFTAGRPAVGSSWQTCAPSFGDTARRPRSHYLMFRRIPRTN